jgi:hypothetical protein
MALLQAQPFCVAGDYNSWNASANQMTAGPGANEYSYTITGQTAGGYASIKVTDGTFNNTWPSGNMTIKYDSTGSLTIHFFPGNIIDGWLPLANRVGYDDPDTDAGWAIAGDFNGYDGTAGVLSSVGSGVYSNTFTVGTASTFGYQFQSPAGSWSNIHFGTDFANGSGNGSFTTTTSPQQVPVSMDVVNGRFLVGNLAPPPVTNQVVFAVDMTYQIQLGYFTPGSLVYAAGVFNGWPGASTGNGLLLVNTPTYNGGSNTNIYYATNTFIGLPGSSSDFKYNQNDADAQNGGWETSDNRTVTLLTTNGTVVLPVGVFSDLYSSEVLTTDTLLTFTVDMTGAVDLFGNPFDPNNDLVLVDGDFLNPQWACLNHPTDPEIQSDYGQNFLTREGATMLYTNSYVVPAGHTLEVTYKYGIYHDSGDLNTNVDNEAGFAQNHSRYIRNDSGVYNFATDIFGQQRTNNAAANEIAFGNLAISAPSGSTFPITWLGLPGVHLQYSTDLNSWTDLDATDGTMSTNWPASGNSTYFRLIRPLQ